MDEEEPITFTTLALIILLVICLVMFICHFLGPRATTWMRSDKEEKIGLSKNKLFHANGYMIQSGSEFLLSNSGSFKRFDTIDKEDYKQSEAQLPAQQTTTALWNLPQADCNIPPQPLRPAPGITTPGKSVTFSFNKINEITMAEQGPADNYSKNIEQPLVSCMRTSSRVMQAPQPLEGPTPHSRLSTTPLAVLSATAIRPRPVVKRQQNITTSNACVEPNQNGINDRTHPPDKQLVRRNSSTNPFLCESVDSLPEVNEHNTALQTPKNIEENGATTQIKSVVDIEKVDDYQDVKSTMDTGIQNGHGNPKNPFYEEPLSSYPDDLNLSLEAQSADVSPEIPGKHFNGTQKTAFNAQKEDNKVQYVRYHNKTNSFRNSPNSINTLPSEKSLLKNHKFLRTRSFSEAVNSSEPNAKPLANKFAPSAAFVKLTNTTNPFASLTQRQKGPHLLQKTISEDYLFRKLGLTPGSTSTNSRRNSVWSFGHSFLQHDSNSSRNSSQCSLNSTGSFDSINLEHAISCDSVNSDSLVFLSDLDQPSIQVTGHLCVALEYDKAAATADGIELTVTVLEAKELICPFNVHSLDTFVRIYLVPDQPGAKQTEIFQNSKTPTYNESFQFWMNRQQERHSLWFHLYHNGIAHTLIGEAEMEIGNVLRSTTAWIPLSDTSRCNAQWGELMFSLSYFPTAERLTIVVVKARNLKLDVRASKSLPKEIQSVFVKVYLMNNEKNVLKKRTSSKRKDHCPIFNESVIFSVPPQSLTTIQLRITIFGVIDETTVITIGHVITGSFATGKGLRHWHQMLSSLRKPVAMWHVLRRATNQPIFTGGPEAVVAAMQSTALRTKRNSVF